MRPGRPMPHTFHGITLDFLPGGAPASSPALKKPAAEGGAPCLLKVLQVLREKSAGETPGENMTERASQCKTLVVQLSHLTTTTLEATYEAYRNGRA